jgi:N-acetylglucosaminyldiphosphoundecaprenol N-acetyl-beta-D-mannosaminyltransferase
VTVLRLMVNSLVKSGYILGSRIDATSYESATRQIMQWADQRRSACIHAANVHMIMEAYDRRNFQALLNNADLNTPDGMPLVHMLRRLANPQQQRVYGPTLMLHVCAAAAQSGTAVALYGGRPEVLAELQKRLLILYPALQIAFAESPPFISAQELASDELVERITTSGARILFVALGCPKQEWLVYHLRTRLSMPMLAVGAAFDFHAGAVAQAPRWIQKLTLEWLYRLWQEPRRLWKRYAWNNPRFIILAGWQYLRGEGRTNV